MNGLNCHAGGLGLLKEREEKMRTVLAVLVAVALAVLVAVALVSVSPPRSGLTPEVIRNVFTDPAF